MSFTLIQLKMSQSTQLKVWHELTAINTFDGVVFTPATPSQLDKLVENSKFIIVWTKRLAVHQIKDYDVAKLDEMEFFIINQPKHIQQMINDRNKEKYDKVWKRFESVAQIMQYLSEKGV